MARRRDSGRSRLRWIVTVLVVAVAAACALLSWGEKTGSESPLSGFDAPAFLTDILDSFDTGNGEAPVTATLEGAGLEVHFIDVGQAESILIKGPNANVLIDAGENDQGDDVVRYLRQNDARTIDYAIGTHPHSDHIGGLDTVISELSVKNVIMPEIPEAIAPTTRTYMDVLAAVRDAGLTITPSKPGNTYDLGDGAELRILGPISEYADMNNMSIVVRLQYGETSFLFTGDACTGAENDIISAGGKVRSDVLSVGHHGSNTSNGENWLDAVSARVAVISCGTDNSYGHPHREVIERLELRNMRILRTDLNGSIIIASDGQRLSVAAEK